MSSDRAGNTSGRPLKPTVAAARVARAPLTPRTAGYATPPTRSTVSKTPSTARSEPPRVTPRGKNEDLRGKDALANGNITPRSSARKSRADSSQNTPTPTHDTPNALRPKTTVASASANRENNGGVGGLGISGLQQSPKGAKQQMVANETNFRRVNASLVRSNGLFDLKQSMDETLDDRFFHASDVTKQEPIPYKPEQRKPVGFFYADGQQEEQRPSASPLAASPVLSAVSEKRTSGPWVRAESASNLSKSPPVLSPALSTLSSISPLFGSVSAQQNQRPSSPSKENIHLSYRKGASQIFGTRPTSRPVDSSTEMKCIGEAENPGETTPYRKSPSLSSIDSGNSSKVRRRSATTADLAQPPSPLTRELKSVTKARTAQPSDSIPSIDTSLGATDVHSPAASALSPTKRVSELAADARRERKVLDLEISNSSLLAINASLEREVRRQKAELKSFRRLSRAGRFSINSSERSSRLSGGLSTLGEEDGEGGDNDTFGNAPSFAEGYEDFSDDDEESITSGGEPLSPGAQTDRLAKDEKRLRVDLEKHKELLVQSQMMNQSIKRCLYASEEMIKDGKKALEYSVRVSDVKLGGRILHDEDKEEVEVEGEASHVDELEQAKGLLDVWQGISRPGFDGSDAGDRDSGIEVDKLPHISSARMPLTTIADSGGAPG